MTASVSILIVNYNAGALLKECLEAVFAQSFKAYEVILVDNASSDDSLSALPSDERLSIIRLSENTGFARANNIAAEKAKGTWLITLNPDTKPAPNWLMTLIDATRRYPDCIMFGSTQINAENQHIIDGSGDLYHGFGVPLRRHHGYPLALLPEEGPVFAPCAAAAMYRKDWFIYVGGFDEDFFCYCEDIDLAFRLRIYGGYAMQIKEAVVYHHASAITGKRSYFSVYHGMRNRFWVFIKNMPSPFFELLFPLHSVLQVAFLCKSILQGQGKAGLCGIIDACHYRNLSRMFQKRRQIQLGRKASLKALVKAMSWSPISLLRR